MKFILGMLLLANGIKRTQLTLRLLADEEHMSKLVNAIMERCSGGGKIYYYCYYCYYCSRYLSLYLSLYLYWDTHCFQ